MAGVLVQETGTSLAGSAGTIPKVFASPNGAGNAIHVFATCDNSGSSVVTLADSNLNTYVLQDNLVNSNTGQRCLHWTAVNIGAGTNTITGTFAPAAAFRGIRIREIGGVGTGTVDGHHGNSQNAVAAAANAVTSGAATNSAQPVFLSAFTLDCDVAETPAPGSGFSDGGSDWDFALGTNGMRSEYQAGVTSIGAQTATFTNSLLSDFVTMIAVFDEYVPPPPPPPVVAQGGGGHRRGSIWEPPIPAELWHAPAKEEPEPVAEAPAPEPDPVVRGLTHEQTLVVAQALERLATRKHPAAIVKPAAWLQEEEEAAEALLMLLSEG